MPVQHFRDGYGCSLPLAARIIGIIDRNHRVGFVYGHQVRFEFAAYSFLIGQVYDFRTGSQGIEIAISCITNGINLHLIELFVMWFFGYKVYSVIVNLQCVNSKLL